MFGRDRSLTRVDRLLRRGAREGFERGLGDGNRIWVVLGAVALGLRLLRWMAREGRPVILTEPLLPGETLVIRHLQPGE